ncbi:unnamed protein product [Trichobilharzia regenti]|nr:unnamed protein product [Trichobilharzia regenti]
MGLIMLILNHQSTLNTTITPSTTVTATATTTMTNNNHATSGTGECNTHPTLPMESSLKAAAAIAAGLNPYHFTNDNVKLVDKCQQSNDASINNIYSNHVNNYPYPGITLGPWDRPTAAHFARVAPRWFARSLNVGVRKTTVSPSIEEICHVKHNRLSNIELRHRSSARQVGGEINRWRCEAAALIEMVRTCVAHASQAIDCFPRQQVMLLAH